MTKPLKSSILSAWTGFRGTAASQDDQSPRTRKQSKKTLKSLTQLQPRTSKTTPFPTDDVEILRPTTPSSHLSRLETLPVDILYLITAILPSEDVYALSLASRTMSMFFCRDQLIIKDPLVKKHFLLHLERNLPDYLVCYTCNRLYRWHFPGSRKVRLCPGRENIPHHDYGRIDITSHSNRIPREMIDLAIRSVHPERKWRTTALKRVSKSLQEKESLDRRLRMRARSYVLTTVLNKSLVVTSVFSVRIRRAETTHPLFWLTNINLPIHPPHLPPATSFHHSRLSTFTRLLGCNYHEFFMFDNMTTSDDYTFLACTDCKSSIRITRDYYFDKWININVETAQAFGTRDDLAGDTWCYAGLTRDHRKTRPNQVIHFMRCLTPAANQPAFAPQNIPSEDDDQDNGSSAQTQTQNQNRDVDLSLNAWFNRHMYVRSQRIWPRPEDPNAHLDDDSDSDSDSDEEIDPAQIPIYTEDAWNDPSPTRVTAKRLSLRKRWFEWSLLGATAVLLGPFILYGEARDAFSSSRQRSTLQEAFHDEDSSLGVAQVVPNNTATNANHGNGNPAP